MSWQVQLERLAQPTDLSGSEMQSSRWRLQQQQQVSSATATPAVAVRPSAAAPAAAFPVHSSISDLACEGCMARTAVVYCSSCDRLMCVDCDSRTHAAPPLQTHQRAPFSQVHAHRIPCPEVHAPSHGSAAPTNPSLLIRFYCRTCARPVCSACRAPGGVHCDSGHAQRHDCVPLAEQCQSQLLALRNAVGSMVALQDAKQRMIGEVSTLAHSQLALSSSVRLRRCCLP